MDYKQSIGKDNWRNKNNYALNDKRPLGVTIIALLQLIGTIFLIGFLILIPLIYDGIYKEVLGEFFFYIYILYIFVMVPMTFILSYGLLKGREWARFYTRFFQIINIISSLISLNILSIIIPIYVFFYLNKPNVIDFFDNKSPLDSRKWPLVFIIFTLILLLSSSIAFYSNPLI